jgi:hypothetical protein
MSFPITLDEIERAYAETGMQPVERTWAIAKGPNEQPCGCPLTAVVAFRHGMSVARDIKKWGRKFVFVAGKLSITPQQAQSFTIGFDNDLNEEGTPPSDTDLEAFAAGCAAREKFLPEKSPA